MNQLPKMQGKTVPFGVWSPDAPSLGHSWVARNVIPGEGGSYRPFPQFDALDDTEQTVASAFTGGFVAFAGDGAVDIIATTASTIYRWDGDSWAVVNNGFTDGEWRFAQWGDEIVATNPTHGFYYANMGGTFSNDASVPAARYIAVIGYHIWLGGLTNYPNAVRWSGFNDRTVWLEGDIASGSDIEYRPREYGAITGIRGGTVEQSVLFQERAISTIAYDPNFAFKNTVIETELGCAASRSIQTYGRQTFFISHEGPAVFDGQAAMLLGEGSFQRWFQDAVSGVTQTPIYSAIDKKNKIVLWMWRPDDADPVCQGLIYNWAERRAAEWRPGVAYPMLMNLPSSIADTNELTTTTIGGYSGDVLQTRISGVQERPRLEENTLIIGSIDPSTDQLGRFNGDAMEATMETPEYIPDRPQGQADLGRATVNGVRLVGDVQPDQVYGTVTSRQGGAGDTQQESTERQGISGAAIPLRASGSTHKVKIRIPASQVWNHVQGVHIAQALEGTS